jgi:hypothetical protein
VIRIETCRPKDKQSLAYQVLNELLSKSIPDSIFQRRPWNSESEQDDYLKPWHSN